MTQLLPSRITYYCFNALYLRPHKIETVEITLYCPQAEHKVIDSLPMRLQLVNGSWPPWSSGYLCSSKHLALQIFKVLYVS